MNIDFQSILISVISNLGGGGLMWLFTLKSTRKSAQANAKKDEAQAESSEVETVGKIIGDVYQETITDLREDKRILKEENTALKEENKSLRDEMRDLRALCEKNAKDIHEIKLLYMKDKCLNSDCKERVTG